MQKKIKIRHWLTLISMLIIFLILQLEVLTKYLLSIVLMLLVLRWIITKLRERLGL